MQNFPFLTCSEVAGKFVVVGLWCRVVGLVAIVSNLNTSYSELSKVKVRFWQ